MMLANRELESSREAGAVRSDQCTLSTVWKISGGKPHLGFQFDANTGSASLEHILIDWKLSPSFRAFVLRSTDDQSVFELH